MKKYEAILIVKPDLSDAEKKDLFNQINDAVVKFNGNVSSASIWAEKRKLCYPIKKYREGIYYLMNFSAPPELITKMNYAYKLNENILRVLITKIE